MPASTSVRLHTLVGMVCAVAVSSFSARAAVKAERVEYHGWKNAWKLTNGAVDLVLVPSIGRIIRYGKVGGPNVLWENPRMSGKLPFASKDWQNFGGDKLWPAPQSAWGWPPDTEIDPGEHEVKLLPNGHLLVSGKASEKSGIRFEREVAMDASGSGVRIINRMINSSQKPLRWAIWEIAQVDDPQYALIPASPASIHPDGYYVFPDNKPAVAPETSANTPVTILLSRNKAKSAKIGSYSERSFAYAWKSGHMFKIEVEGKSAPSAAHSDAGCSQEIYTSPDPDKYVELELLGPVQELKPGERAQQVVRWKLEQIRTGSVRP